MLSKADIVSLIQKKKDFPKSFSARKAWMLIHQKIPEVGVDEFSEKLQNISKVKDEESANFYNCNSPDIGTIFEYVTDERGVRFYSFIVKNNNNCIKSHDLINKIKYGLCTNNSISNKQTTDNNNIDLNNQIYNENNNNNEVLKSFSDHDFMTEKELSSIINIKLDRINPFISILIELGIIIVENKEKPSINLRSMNNNILATSNFKHEIDFQKDMDHQFQFSFQKNCSKADTSESLFDSNDLVFEAINIDSNLSINEIKDQSEEDSKNVAIDQKQVNRDLNINEDIDDDINVYKNSVEKIYEESQVNENTSQKSKFLNLENLYIRRRIKWDESREMRRKNLSNSFEYLNKLRSMKNSLINSILEANGKI